jgi:hypothetical protein
MRDTRDRMHKPAQHAIQECRDCHDICIHTINHCLRVGGMHTEVRLMRLLQDAVEICRTSIDFMVRGSDQSPQVLSAAAEICDNCAASCERIRDDDELKACAQICRRCAQACRDVGA